MINEQKKYSIKEACSIIATKTGGETPLHTNTLLKYRTRWQNELSPSAKPGYQGPVMLSAKDIDIIVQKLQRAQDAIKRRKNTSPAPTPATTIIKKLEAAVKQLTEKVNILEEKIITLERDEVSPLYGEIEDHEEQMRIFDTEYNLLKVAYHAQQKQIESLTLNNATFTIVDLSSKIDVLIESQEKTQNTINGIKNDVKEHLSKKNKIYLP